MDFWMVVCLCLVVVVGGLKFKTRVHINALKTELAGLKEKRQKAAGQHHLVEQEQEALQLAEKELVLDCRDLHEEWQKIQERMKKIEDLTQRHVQRQEEENALDEETDDGEQHGSAL